MFKKFHKFLFVHNISFLAVYVRYRRQILIVVNY
uniref:Uncharacterized protein n=1 Tax=Siphoviridae sp. ctnpt50 TaxID=2827941 RepID=A0A8S5SDQ6_9CAUD|nr:MAG TPA: hypothetical protein [Siphoviridae sp. ctnpt50]